MFEFVEIVVYINLDHRTDRRSQIESELVKYFPHDKIIRLSAIKHSHGGIGCTQSHIKVLEIAIEQGWKNYLVVEDDAMWSNFEKGYEKLENLLKNPFDVITLGSVYAKYTPEFKLISGQTTTAYIVQQKYYETLLKNFKEGLHGFLTTGNYPVYSIDQYWKKLQAVDNWYCIIPSLMIQRPGYSDIEKAVIDNGRYFS
jgi:GR25 family glycosyltransferase involved in LPS biosynthesis